MSKGCSSEPSKIRFTPGRITSLLSASSGSAFVDFIIGVSSMGLVAASYTGVRAYDLQYYWTIIIFRFLNCTRLRQSTFANHSSR
jgi:hypothetical protein